MAFSQSEFRAQTTPVFYTVLLMIINPVNFYLPSGQDNDINLMKACWNELFALGLAQCSNVMNVSTILAAIINHLQTSLQDGTGGDGENQYNYLFIINIYNNCQQRCF